MFTVVILQQATVKPSNIIAHEKGFEFHAPGMALASNINGTAPALPGQAAKSYIVVSIIGIAVLDSTAAAESECKYIMRVRSDARLDLFTRNRGPCINARRAEEDFSFKDLLDFANPKALRIVGYSPSCI